MDLHCAKCGWCEYCGPTAMAERLRAAGMLRRNTDASPEEMAELLKAVAARSACPGCGAMGLALQESPEDRADWPEGAACKSCGKPIPAERLEALPGATLCATCQRNEERGIDTWPADYCPRCGAVMTLRQTRGSGITRYVLACPACGGRTKAEG